jgi:hypothetical protein
MYDMGWDKSPFFSGEILRTLSLNFKDKYFVPNTYYFEKKKDVQQRFI